MKSYFIYKFKYLSKKRFGLFVFCFFSLSCRQELQPQSLKNKPKTESLTKVNEAFYHQSKVTMIERMTHLSQVHYVFGHENGALSLWPRPLKPTSQPEEVWLAHEASVRQIQSNSQSILSLSSKGSWATWSSKGLVLSRGRLIDTHVNLMLNLRVDQKELQVFGDARGTVSVMHKKKRLWRSAGEHGRAVFGLLELDQRRFVSVGSDGYARCWESLTGDQCGAIQLHQAWITVLKSLKHNWLSAGSDGLIKIWHTPFSEHGKQAKPSKDLLILEYKALEKNITALAISDSFILTGGESGELALHSYDLEQLQSQAQSQFQVIKPIWRIQEDHLRPIRSVLIDQEIGIALVAGGSKLSLYSYPLYLGKGQAHPQAKELHFLFDPGKAKDSQLR